MSVERTKAEYRRTRLSYAHENLELRQQNGLYEKAYRNLNAANDVSLDPGRDEYKRKREQPKLILRPPTPTLGPGQDATAPQPTQDDLQARRAFVSEAKAEVSDLKNAQRQVRSENKTARHVQRLEREGRLEEAGRETYRAMRRIEQIDRRSEERFQAFFHRHAQTRGQ